MERPSLLEKQYRLRIVNGSCLAGTERRLAALRPHAAKPSPENIAILGWKGLMVKIQLGLNSAGLFYSELISQVGSSVGVADGEPYWNAYLGQWQVWVNFADGCKSVVCDWLVAI